MTTVSTQETQDAWLERLSKLVSQIKNWAEAAGWSSRTVEVTLHDSQVGNYKAPALLMQENAVKLLLEPIARSAPGADGVVDLYLVPAYDDVANLYFCDGSWQIRYPHAGELADSLFREGDTKTLSSASIREVLEAMKTHADQQA